MVSSWVQNHKSQTQSLILKDFSDSVQLLVFSITGYYINLQFLYSTVLYTTLYVLIVKN